MSLMYCLKSVWAFFSPSLVCFIAEKGVCLRIRRLAFSRPNTLPWFCKSFSTSCKTLHRTRFVRGRLFKRESKEGGRREREKELGGGSRKEGRRERRKRENGGEGMPAARSGSWGSAPRRRCGGLGPRERGAAGLGGGREGAEGERSDLRPAPRTESTWREAPERIRNGRGSGGASGARLRRAETPKPGSAPPPGAAPAARAAPAPSGLRHPDPARVTPHLPAPPSFPLPSLPHRAPRPPRASRLLHPLRQPPGPASHPLARLGSARPAPPQTPPLFPRPPPRPALVCSQRWQDAKCKCKLL